ncbi:MAG TPA: hypothetical protein VFS50_07880 [Meiothermus sp.]|nr:hypothetical protein [Meiothermus sp.]
MHRLLVLLLLSLPAFAQTLVEVTTVAAISSSLDASVRLPSGSYRAGKGSDLILARMPDAAKFNLEVFAAKGVAVRLQPAFIQQVLTSFAAAGYLLEGQQERNVSGEAQTRYNLSDASGKQAVLFVVRKGDELVYAFGKAK